MNYEQVQLEHIDRKYSWIETYIKVAADRLSKYSEEEIVKKLEEQQIGSSNIFLIMQGAKLLYSDRINAPPKQSKIKRV